MKIATAVSASVPVIVLGMALFRGFSSVESPLSIVAGDQLTSVMGVVVPLVVSLYYVLFPDRRWASASMLGLLIYLVCLDGVSWCLGYEDCGCLPGWTVHPLVSGAIGLIGFLVVLRAPAEELASNKRSQSTQGTFVLHRLCDSVICLMLLAVASFACGTVSRDLFHRLRSDAVQYQSFTVNPSSVGSALIVVTLQNHSEAAIDVAGLACPLPVTTAVEQGWKIQPHASVDVPVLLTSLNRSGTYPLKIIGSDQAVAASVRIHVIRPFWRRYASHRHS